MRLRNGRHTHCVDRIDWDGHGFKFPRSRGLCNNMVSIKTLVGWCESPADPLMLRDFVSQVQQHLLTLGGPGKSPSLLLLLVHFAHHFSRALTSRVRYIDDALSDDAMDGFANPLVLPSADLKYLEEIEHTMRGAVSTPQGRDALSKFVIGEDYIRKLIPLVGMAEDLEATEDLHHLCNIMKMLILLNDTQIIEHVVSDGVVDGVVGALECKSPVG